MMTSIESWKSLAFPRSRELLYIYRILCWRAVIFMCSVTAVIPILESFAPKPWSTNRGVNPLATAFVVTGFTPGLIRQKDQTLFKSVLVGARLVVEATSGGTLLGI